MLNLDRSPLELVSRSRDARMTLPGRPGDAPREALLGRRIFALAPWIAVAVVAAAYGVSELLRGLAGHGITWSSAGAAFGVALFAAFMAAVQDTAFGLRYRRSMWAFGAFSAALIAGVAVVAMTDGGVTSTVFAGMGPIAMYLALVAPPAWRVRTLGVLVAATACVHAVAPHTAWFDALIVLTLIVASWFCGVLASVAHVRTAKIARRLTRFDAATRSLSRRGFMEQLEHAMSPLQDEGRPVALLLAGVEIDPAEEPERVLRWIGTAVAAVLPHAAELGRVSDRELAILLPGLTRREAAAVAEEILGVLSVRVRATVGLATTETRHVSAADLFRVADAARVVAAREGRGVHTLVAGTVTEARPAIAAIRRPVLSYADIRLTGKVPRLIAFEVMERRIAVFSLLAVAAAGVPIVLRGMLSGDAGLAADVVRFGGLPWVAAVVLMAAATHRWARRGTPLLEGLLVVASACTISGGIAVAALATGGLLSPIIAALVVKTLFDTMGLDRRSAHVSLASVVAAWLSVALLGPATALWAAPFHFALIGGAYAFGRITQTAMTETADHARDRAHTDELTQFSNRAGFVELAEAAFYRSVTETGTPLAVLTFHLDALRRHNETHGYAAGDALLRSVAGTLEARIPGYYVIGRTSATTFSAAVAVSGSLAASGLAHDLCAVLAEHTTVRAGCATCPGDGATLAALMEVAERDARAGKAAVA